MTFSQYAGVAVVPTLARLVLAAVFLFAGYTKLFTRSDFEATADQKGAANTLHNLDVDLMPKNPPAAPTSAQIDGQWTLVLAALRQETPAQAPQTPAEQTPPAASPPPTSTAASGALPPGTYTAPTLYHIALKLNSHNWPQPVAQAWLAALTEFVGGGMLLIGLFSRIWGLALAGVMGVAFYLTSLPVLQTHGFFELSPADSSTLFLQTALFVLAMGIALTGAGPLSLDRLLFTRTATVESDKQVTEVRRTVLRD